MEHTGDIDRNQFIHVRMVLMHGREPGHRATRRFHWVFAVGWLAYEMWWILRLYDVLD